MFRTHRRTSGHLNPIIAEWLPFTQRVNPRLGQGRAIG